MYLSYDEYKEYGGTLDKTAFSDLEMDAESTINWYTFNRLKRPEWADVLDCEELKRCTYQLIRLKQMENEMMESGLGAGAGLGWKKEAGIVQESNDGVTTRYNLASTGDLLLYLQGKKPIIELIDKYIGSITNDMGRKLLYRGVYKGE